MVMDLAWRRRASGVGWSGGQAAAAPASARRGKLRWEGRASRRPRAAVGSFFCWGRSGGGVGGVAGAVALVDRLVVGLVGREQMVEDAEPAVGEGAQGHEVRLASLTVVVVVGAGPGRAGERAEGPAE